MKKKNYGLYVKVEGVYHYPLNEAVKEDGKRPHNLMNASLIEELDDMTAGFESFEEMNQIFKEVVYNDDKNMYEPIIIVDKDETDREKSYVISDIVYAKDKIEIENKDNLKEWLTDYLKNNNQHISLFRGINEIYDRISKKPEYRNKSIDSLIEMTVYAYLVESGYNYKKRREAYFTLKYLDKSKVKKNEIHK